MNNRQTPILQLNQISLTDPTGFYSLLQEISFSVAKGEIVAIVGGTGAGKSSLLRLLNRLSEPTAGTIAFAGQPFSQIPPIQLRQRVVLVPQEPKLLGMTVGETLAYPLRLQKLPEREIQQRLDTWRSRLSIPEDWWKRNELQLSLGQRQLISIARGLAMEPQVLLLDEPTSALDAGSTNCLVEALHQLGKEKQVTILMVNHQLEVARQFAQRILYLQQGQLLADSPADQLDWGKLREKLIQAEANKILNSEF